MPTRLSAAPTAHASMIVDTRVARSHEPAKAAVTRTSTGRTLKALVRAETPSTGPGLRRMCLTDPSSRSPKRNGAKGMIPGLAPRVRA